MERIQVLVRVGIRVRLKLESGLRHLLLFLQVMTMFAATFSSARQRMGGPSIATRHVGHLRRTVQYVMDMMLSVRVRVRVD